MMKVVERMRSQAYVRSRAWSGSSKGAFRDVEGRDFNASPPLVGFGATFRPDFVHLVGTDGSASEPDIKTFVAPLRAKPLPSIVTRRCIISISAIIDDGWLTVGES